MSFRCRRILEFGVAAVFAIAALPAQEFGQIPQGFTSILARDSLTGWSISPTNRHGHTQMWRVKDGVLTIGQDKPGHGGLLVTKTKYRNFEIYLEVWPDWGCDGGLFLRTNGEGQGYQVMIDYLEKGNIGGVFLANVQDPAFKQAKIGSRGGEGWEGIWKRDGWNSIRARIEGANAHIAVWLNEVKVTDFTFPRNFLPGGAEENSIGLQVHLGNRWAEGKVHRYRNIAVKELN
jgi:hypothetical protein